MRKIGIYSIAIICFIALCFLGYYAVQAQNGNPASTDETESSSGYRLVLITKELDTPFWDKVGEGAMAAAARNHASIEVWGSYGLNEQDFLKEMEIAIASKVDGIIVQGLDTAEFKQLAMYKATENGIPVITVANDVPMNESLRKTYVGSNHFEAGQMIARQLLSDMGFNGKVVLLTEDRQEDFQRARLKGILEVLNNYPMIHTDIVDSGNSREQVVKATNNVLNRIPDVRAFVTTTANNASAIIQEIEKRRKVDNYLIYSFDDSPETQKLVKQGKIDAIVSQSPQEMGEMSVDLMISWLKGELLPLSSDGYYTDIRVLKAEKRK
ncbi:substrate-binding domain-containing protein [Cohnella terricola]|uniref:Sugar ABC transporter substrate-binding protein n=1 Tax=Cohnella terricola TaxID=1289167 RepID=A0A559JN43_9BACL|nr:substrate-binding domain-containing protein [Cohnella terricola]TVY01297.1 sugar ABC transporter substrate-binding protein [Cohnella terricola]